MGIRETVLAAFFACIFGFLIGGSFVWSYQFPESNPKIANAAHEQETARPDTQKQGEDALATYTWWLTFFTGILAVATVGLGVATAGLYLAGERQLAHLKKASDQQSAEMQASIKVARDSAKAAARSADTAEHTLAMFDRPWIEIDIKIDGPLIFGGETISVPIRATYKNVGRSPALEFGFSASLHANIAAAAIAADEAAIQAAHIPSVGSLKMGAVVFPKRGDLVEQLISISRDEFLLAIEKFNGPLPASERKKGLNPAIMAFAFYRLPTARSATGFKCSTVLLEICSSFAQDGFDGSAAEFSADNLELVRTVFNGQTT